MKPLDLKYALQEGIVKILVRVDHENGTDKGDLMASFCIYPQRCTMQFADTSTIVFNGRPYSTKDLFPLMDTVDCHTDEEWHTMCRINGIMAHDAHQSWCHYGKETITYTLLDWFVLNVVDRFRKKKSP